MENDNEDFPMLCFLTFLKISGILHFVEQKEIEYFSLFLKFTLHICNFLPLLTFLSINSSLNTLHLLNYRVSSYMSLHRLNVTVSVMPLDATVLL